MSHVYFFGEGRAEGTELGKKILGGKGANLAEMARLGIPVPPGLIITTDACKYYSANGRLPDGMMEDVHKKMKELNQAAGKTFADASNPLLVSVRSGAPVSMPGMMDTILNLGLNPSTVDGLIKQTSNPRFVNDSYRRFIQMFSDVVLGVEHHDFEVALEAAKKQKGVKDDTGLDADDLKKLIEEYKKIVRKDAGIDFPDDPYVQLEKAIEAVFKSWDNDRAKFYRKLNGIPDDLGTAINVQAMVFGNMGEDSGTGVAFTRDPSTGERKFYGEFLMNAQGEDVVAGIRTPHPIKDLQEIMPEAYSKLFEIQDRLEKHFKDMQDIEFTIQQKKLYLLQTRSGKRTGFAALRIAVEMVDEGLIDKKTALMRVDPETVPSLLAPIFHQEQKKKAVEGGRLLTKGLNAGPGAASAALVLSSQLAQELALKGQKTILVRFETSPEDIIGMEASEGILTARGGMTSHAAVVARGMNKPCVVGCSALQIDIKAKTMTVKKSDGSVVTLAEGDDISIDGSTGEVLKGHLDTQPSEIDQALHGENGDVSRLAEDFIKLLSWADEVRRLRVRANADIPRDAKTARMYGAEGIGLCRTEHMFFGGERILAMREMILAETAVEREKALAKILPYQREDFEGLFQSMNGLPVTIRLLDPPLHEFLPHTFKEDEDLAKSLGISPEKIRNRVQSLHEMNPMLGHRGCRLGITYPEITRMQVRAIFEAACNIKKKGIDVKPEVMVPLVGHEKELKFQKEIIDSVAKEVMTEKGIEIAYLAGTMIEVPRAAIRAAQIAEYAQFFSFGTNDLTQMTLAFSRDDAGSFLGDYVDRGIYERSPFVTIDQDGVGDLIKIAIERGKQIRPNIKLGVCGEHGGDSASIHFFNKIGLDYVSCSPFRVAVARLAAAQAALSQS